MQKVVIKKKKINIFLVPAVLFIWGFIIYRVISFQTPPDEEISGLSSKPVIPIVPQKQDTLKVNANYRDPFKPFKQLPSSKSSQTLQIKPVDKNIRPKVSWPVINYGGLIKNTNEVKILAILTVGERTFIAGKNDNISGLRILNLYKDSILLKYQNEKKIIIKRPK
jgi:hypothetical protein